MHIRLTRFFTPDNGATNNADDWLALADNSQAAYASPLCIDVYDIFNGTCQRYASTDFIAEYTSPNTFNLIGGNQYNTQPGATVISQIAGLYMTDWLRVWDLLPPVLSARYRQCPSMVGLRDYIIGDGTSTEIDSDVTTAFADMYLALNRAMIGLDNNRTSQSINKRLMIALRTLYPLESDMPDSIAGLADIKVDTTYQPPATKSKQPVFHGKDSGSLMPQPFGDV